MKYLLILVLAIGVSCSDKSKKVTADLMTTGIVNSVAVALECSAVNEVEADVKPVVYNWFNMEISRSVGQDLCKLAISSIIPQVLKDGIVPKKWSCKLEKIEDAAALLGEAVCENL